MSSAAPTPERADRDGIAARVATLFGKHGRMVYGICRAMLRDAHEAEDATQQTFLSAHRALLGGAQVRDEGGWLATIARNECRARITAGMRRPLTLGDDDLALVADSGDEVARRERSEAIRQALAELPERQREAVVLRDLYGLRYGEVARALGLSLAATETLLFRARRSLRQRLRPVVTTALVVPLSIQEGLAQAIPGFSAAPPTAALAAGTAGGGLLAKLVAGPASAKIATAAVAVTTVGTIGAVEPERGGRDRAERPTAVVSLDRSDDESGTDSSGGSHESSEVSGSRGTADNSGRRSDTGSDDAHGSGDERSGDDHSIEGPGGDRGGSSGQGGGDGDDGQGSHGSGEAVDGLTSPPGQDHGDDSSGPSSSSESSSGRGSGSESGSGHDDDDSSGGGSGSSGSSGSGEDDSSGGGSGSGQSEEELSGDGSSGDDQDEDGD